MITRRTTQRQFLLRPDDETNNAFVYCMAEAAQRFGIDVILPSVLSNHHHLIVFDRHGNIIDFMQQHHKMFAKCQNALRGRSENLWASEPPCLVELVDREAVLAKLLYAAINPVKDGLVERVRHWPGVNGLSALLNDRPMTAKRPRHFFSKEGEMPALVELRLVIPPELGDADELRRMLRELVEAAEQRYATQRTHEGKRVMGRRAILRQSWNDSPTSDKKSTGIRPRLAARSVWSRVEALCRDRAFLCAYREARLDMIAGRAATFPPGTYWLRRFAGVSVASS
jgi:hypothetical protein